MKMPTPPKNFLILALIGRFASFHFEKTPTIFQFLRNIACKRKNLEKNFDVGATLPHSGQPGISLTKAGTL